MITYTRTQSYTPPLYKIPLYNGHNVLCLHSLSVQDLSPSCGLCIAMDSLQVSAPGIVTAAENYLAQALPEGDPHMMTHITKQWCKGLAI